MARISEYHSRLLVLSLGLLLCHQVGYAENADLVKTGETLYNQNCIFCHQPDAIGKPGLAPSLTNPELLAISSDKYLMGTIRDGRKGTSMVPYAHLGRHSDSTKGPSPVLVPRATSRPARDISPLSLPALLVYCRLLSFS